MSGFDLAAERARLRISLPRERTDRPPPGSNAASMVLGEAVTGWILGLEDEARPVAGRARAWLEESVRRGEGLGETPQFVALRRVEALGVARWMADEPAAAQFAEAVALFEPAFAAQERRRPVSDAELLADYLPDHIRDCVLAGEHRAGAAAYERHGGRPPAGADDVATPLELAAWLCREHAAGRRVDPAVRAATGARVLREPLADWLDHGHGVRAAAWIKLAFSDSGVAPTAREAFARAGELLADDPPGPLATVLAESLGDPVEVDLFGGFLAAVGAALARDGAILVADPPPSPAFLVAGFHDRLPLSVAVAPAQTTGGLDEAVAAALAAEAATLPGAPPRLADLLEAVADAARGRIVDGEGAPLALHEVAVRQTADLGDDLGEEDWRDRIAALVMVGRLGLAELAPLAQEVEIPPASVGLREDDRRVLLALRDMAAARAQGRPFHRPVHPDPRIAAARAALLADLEAVLDGTTLPGPDSPAYVLRAILDPDAVRGSSSVAPEWWPWLGQA
jgi:hypothetical protein